MSDPYVLLSTAEIDAAAFAGFLSRIGGTLNQDGSGRLSRGRRHVWIYPEPIDAEDAKLAARLGAPPRSKLVLELSRAPETGKLASVHYWDTDIRQTAKALQITTSRHLATYTNDCVTTICARKHGAEICGITRH